MILLREVVCSRCDQRVPIKDTVNSIDDGPAHIQCLFICIDCAKKTKETILLKVIQHDAVQTTPSNS